MTKTAEKLDQETIEGIKPYSGDLVPSPQAVPAVPVQRVQTQYVTAVAVQKPRQLTVVTNNVLKEAELAGVAFYFRWEVWNKQKKKMVPIQGGSIDLAMCIARNYGNCVIDIDVEELPSHWIFRAVFIDLETGFSFPRVFRQRRAQDLGKMDDDRAQDMTFQIGQSKAQRNAVLKAVPGWLIDQAIEVARTAEIGKIKTENIVLARAKVVDFFDKYGVEVEALEAKAGRTADMWTAEDIAGFRSTATAIKEGQVDAKDVFGKSEAESKSQEKIDALDEQNVDPERKKAAGEIADGDPVDTGIPEDFEPDEEYPTSDFWAGVHPDDMPAGPPLWKEENYKGRRSGNGTTTGLAGWVNRTRHILAKAPNGELAKILTKWATHYKIPFPTLKPLNPDQPQGEDRKTAHSSSEPSSGGLDPNSSADNEPPPWGAGDELEAARKEEAEKDKPTRGPSYNQVSGEAREHDNPTVNRTGFPEIDDALAALGPDGPEIYDRAKNNLHASTPSVGWLNGAHTTDMAKAIAKEMSAIVDQGEI